MTNTVSKRDVIEAFQQAVAHAMTCSDNRTIASRDEHMLWYLIGWVATMVGISAEEMPRVIAARETIE